MEGKGGVCPKERGKKGWSGKKRYLGGKETKRKEKFKKKTKGGGGEQDFYLFFGLKKEKNKGGKPAGILFVFKNFILHFFNCS